MTLSLRPSSGLVNRIQGVPNTVTTRYLCATHHKGHNRQDMGLPAELLKSVCFLCVKRAHRGTQGFQYAGTAFFVSVPSDVQPSVSYIYLVTARENVKEAQAA